MVSEDFTGQPRRLAFEAPVGLLSMPFPGGAPAGGFSLPSRRARLASEGFRSRSYAHMELVERPRNAVKRKFAELYC
jgi:hypothetical protein